jgi:5'-nucleotidase
MSTNSNIKMKALSLLTALGVTACGSNNQEPPPVILPPVTISLLSLNDFHGALLPPTGSVTVADPANATGTKVSAGGIAYLSSLINQLKAKNPEKTLVVAAGDMLGGSPLNSALFHDEATIEALNSIGLDFSAVGVHELDNGRDELLRIQNGGCFPKTADGSKGNIGIDTCMTNAAFSGAKFKYLSANIVDKKTGQTLFPSYYVRTIEGVDIGFIGATLKEAPTLTNPAGSAGMSFLDEADSVNKLVTELKLKGVSSIVVLLHQGGTTTASTINDKSCPGLSAEIIALTDKLAPEVDVVISGRSHQEYNCKRPDGKLLTQAGFNGRIVSKIDLTIDPQLKKVIAKEANNIVVINDVGVKDSKGVLIPLPAGMSPLAKDTTMAALVQRYVDASATVTNIQIGSLTSFIGRTANTAGENKMGDLVADIYLNGSSGTEYGNRPAEIALANPGGIRASLETSLQVSYAQLFAVMPFGNNLTTMDLTGTQLLRLLEQQWEAPQPAGGRVMQISNGFSYSWDASQPEGAARGSGNRVVAGSMMLNGTSIDLNKIYRITVNNFMSTGGDNYTVLTSGSNIQQGYTDIVAGEAYFRKLGTIPTPSQARITRIN